MKKPKNKKPQTSGEVLCSVCHVEVDIYDCTLNETGDWICRWCFPWNF